VLRRRAFDRAGRTAGALSRPLRPDADPGDGDGGRGAAGKTSAGGGAALLRAVGVQSLRRRRAHRPGGPRRRRQGGLQQRGVRGRVVDARRLLRGLAATSSLLHQVSHRLY